MRRLLSSATRHFQRLWVAYLVLLLSLIPTAVVYYRVKAAVELRDRARFERVVREEAAAVRQGIPHCVEEMMGIRGLFAANSSVNQEQWQKYIASIEIQNEFPGLRTLGYLERVNNSDGKKLYGRGRANGSASKTQSSGESDVRFPTLYATSFAASVNAEPLDHFTEPLRRPIMELARDSGQAKATASIPLPDDINSAAAKSGLVVYLPVFRNGEPTSSVAERREALQGFIFANFDSDKLIKGIVGAQNSPLINCTIYDGIKTTPEHLLFAEQSNVDLSRATSPALTNQVTLRVLNRTWLLNFASLPSFAAEAQQNLPLIALVCWLTLSFMLFGITYAETNARTRSERMTDQLRASETALAAEKERLAVTLYSIGDGVITTDTAGRVLSVNKVAEQLTGWSQAEATGKPLGSFFNIVSENTRETCLNPLATALQSGAACSLAQPAVLIARDGRERVIADSAAPIRDRSGEVIGAVVVFRDVTAKQKSEAEFLRESKLESVGLLAGGIAHDFNNILQGILGNLSLARMNSHSTEKMLERLAGVEKSAMRAKDLTQQLVMFARGGMPIRKVLQLTNSVKDATLLALHGTNVNCEFSLATDVWPVDVDDGQFRQVINNIVLNAAQAMPNGGKLEVRTENVEFTSGFLTTLNPGNYVKVSIQDYGVGIQPDVLPRIFDPYFTTRKHARGLGLASAYSVVRKHDGQIHVETQPDQGSTFHIYLPASVKVVPPSPSDTEQKRFFGQGRVLVMDDEVDILTLVREMLELMGYEVEVARDGAEALQRYVTAKRNQRPFSAVIMDLTIPQGMGGKEAIRYLTELDPEVKALVSSGYSYDPVMANFREYGFCGVIPKPYVMEDLSRAIAELIRNPKPSLDTVAAGPA